MPDDTSKEPRYFVAVFGDSQPDKDRVESGLYQAGEGYPPFEAVPGDVLLLYCTDEYANYRMLVPGIGIVLQADRDTVKYRWLPFSEPISRELILKNFDTEDASKMRQLGITVHRLFTISRSSFANTVTGRPIRWEKLS